MAGLSGIGQIGTALNDKKKADLLAKEGGLRIKQLQDEEAKRAREDANRVKMEGLTADTERRGALTPAAMEGKQGAGEFPMKGGAPAPDGRVVDFQAIQRAKSDDASASAINAKMRDPSDSEAKLYSQVYGGMPMSGGAFRKLVTEKAVAANQADQAAIKADERDTETHVSKMANDKAARETDRFTFVPLGGDRLGAGNTRTGAIADTGEKTPPKPIPKATDPDAGLPLDVKEQIKGLSSKNAGKIAIANQMESYLQEFQAAPTEDEKARIGGMMLKVLNSPEGSDAIGVEEAKRLGDALEYNVFDLAAGTGMKTGNLHGRDLAGFEKQVTSTIAAVRGGTDRNRSEVDRLYGRQPGAAPADTATTDRRKKWQY